MKKVGVFVCLLVLTIGFVSAGWFGDLFKQFDNSGITGNQILGSCENNGELNSNERRICIGNEWVQCNSGVEGDELSGFTCYKNHWCDGITKIMPIGDSISAQSPTSAYGHENNYRYWLWGELRNNGHYCVDFVGNELDEGSAPGEYDRDHEGHGGFWTGSFLQEDPSIIEIAVSDHNPDIALIHLGINNLRGTANNNGDYTVAISTAIDNLGEIIDVLRTGNPNIVVMVARIYSCTTSDILCQIPVSEVEAFNSEIVDTLVPLKNTVESPIIVVDQFSGFNSVIDTFDSLHPDQSGAEKLSDRWYVVLDSLLNPEDPNDPDPVPVSDFVSVQGDKFILNGQDWRPHGVNFWPSYADFSNTNDRNTHWLDNSQYDPAVISTELANIRDMGFNSVLIQNRPYVEGRVCESLNDFLDKADFNDLKVMLFTSGCDPTGEYRRDARNDGIITETPDYGNCGKIIQECGLAENTALFAYDIAWEPAMIDYTEYSGLLTYFWTEWLKERYRSIANAQANIGYVFSYDSNGYVNAPTETEICGGQNIAEIRVSNVYRSFWSDWNSKEYTKAANKIRSVDPNHLVSARTGGGLVYVPFCTRQGVDVRSLGNAFDFLGPENYVNVGHGSEYADTKAVIGYLTRYSSLGNKKPVVFMEFGYNQVGVPEQDQKVYFRKTYNGLQEAGAAGSFAWWYVTPGGIRPGENSDFGIVRYPDLSEKSVVGMIRNKALGLVSSLSNRAVNNWIIYDDSNYPANELEHLDGINEYSAGLAAGVTSEVITSCTGTNSRTPYKTTWPFYMTSAQCSGNIPFNGNCPLKCLNSQFDVLQIQNSDGEWQDIEDGSIVRVDGDVYLRASIANIGEGTWLKSRDDPKGFVSLKSIGGGIIPIEVSKNIRFLDKFEINDTKIIDSFVGVKSIDFSLKSQAIARFGESIDKVLIASCSAEQCVSTGGCLEENDLTSNTRKICEDALLYQCNTGRNGEFLDNYKCVDNHWISYTEGCSGDGSLSGNTRKICDGSAYKQCNSIIQGNEYLGYRCNANHWELIAVDCNYDDICSDGEEFGVCADCQCDLDSDCGDGNVCTTDSCVAGRCDIINNAETCSDGDSCTESDVCYLGVCSGTDIETLECGFIPDCEESNWNYVLSPEVCTTDGVQDRIWSKTGVCEGGVIHVDDTVSCLAPCEEGDWTNALDPFICPSSEQTKTWSQIGTCDPSIGVDKPSSEIISCVYNAPVCTYEYSVWGECTISNTRSHVVTSAIPAGCQGNPILEEPCVYIPECEEGDWSSSLDPLVCPASGEQTLLWSQSGGCVGGVSHLASEVVSCNYEAPFCTYEYSVWGECTISNTRSHVVTSATPDNCQGNPNLEDSCTYIPTCTDFNWEAVMTPSICPASGEQTKTWNQIGQCEGGVQKFEETINCNYDSPICEYDYSEWSVCTASNTKSRVVIDATPAGCQGNPNLEEPCVYTPLCTEDDWSSVLSPSVCPASGEQIKTWNQPGQCDAKLGVSHSKSEVVSCNYESPECSYVYGNLGVCTSSGTQSQEVISVTPVDCQGDPVLELACYYIPLCTDDNWEFDLIPAECPNSGEQTKNWTKIGICEGGVDRNGTEEVSCDPDAVTCTDFTYGEWGECLQSDIQTRALNSSIPLGCVSGSPALTQNCTYVYPNDNGDDSSSSSSRTRTRSSSSDPIDKTIIVSDDSDDSLRSSTDQLDDSESINLGEKKKEGGIIGFLRAFFCKLRYLFSSEKYNECILR